MTQADPAASVEPFKILRRLVVTAPVVILMVI